MSTQRRILNFAAVSTAVALAATLAGCGGTAGSGSENGDEGGEIRIGQLLPLSGPLADLGTRVGNGAEIARIMANENNCLDGEFLWETVDAPDDQAARQGAERLMNDGVDVVYGTYGSSLSLAASPVVARAGGIYWEQGASANDLTERELDGFYRVNATAGLLGSDAVDFAAETIASELGVEPAELTVGFAGVNTSYGEDVMSGVEAAADEHGMEVVVEAQHASDATDLSSVALQLKDADPDIVVLTNYPPDGAVLGRAMRAAGVNPVAFIGTGGAHADPSWVDSMGTTGNGFFNVGTTPNLDSSGLLPEAQDRSERFFELFEEEFEAKPQGFDRMGFDGAWTLFETICSAGGTDPEAIKAAVAEIDLPERSLIGGDGVKYDDEGQNERVGWFVSQWQDDELVPVAPTDLATGEAQMFPLPEWNER